MNFMKIRKNCRKSQFCYLEKGALKLRRVATTKRDSPMEEEVYYGLRIWHLDLTKTNHFR